MMSHALAYNQPCERPAPPGPIDSGLIGRDNVVVVVSPPEVEKNQQISSTVSSLPLV